MKQALLVGSSFSACPLLFSLKKRGLKVSVCGNLPQDPCHSYADESFFVDYSKVDELAGVLKEKTFDYLVPSCNDAGYLSCAKLSEKYNLFGYDSFKTTELLHKKSLFRNFASSLGLNVPRFLVLESDEPPGIGCLQYPVLVKPVDSFSGRGMTKLADANALSAALRHARSESREAKVVIEEFVEGTLHSHSAFLVGGKIVRDFFVDEFCSVYPYQVDCSNHPSAIKEPLRSDVRSQMQKLVTHLHLCDGLLHTQFMISQNKAYIIECMRRAPGDLYNVLIERSTGFPYADAYVSGFLGEKPIIPTTDRPPRNFSRHTVSCLQVSKFESLKIQAEPTGCEFFPLQASGQQVGAAPFDKFGIAFMEHVSETELFAITAKLATRFVPSSYNS